MAKPNYSFEKRRRELAKKQKKEEKRLKKAQGAGGPDEASPESTDGTPTPAQPPESDPGSTR